MINGRCADHHFGNVCYMCQKGYLRFGINSHCQSCKSNYFFYIKFIVSFLFFIVYIHIQIKVTLNKSFSVYTGILLKQLLTHFQQISIITLIDLGWTEEFKTYFSFQTYISFTSGEILNADCFSEGIDANPLIKTITTSLLLPIILSIIFFIILLFEEFIDYIRSKGFDFNNVLSDFKIAVIVIISMLFPDIVTKCFSLMNCIEIDDYYKISALLNSPEIECWSAYHLFYIYVLAIPGLLAWGILYPLILLYIMYMNNIIIKEMIQAARMEYRMRIQETDNDSLCVSPEIRKRPFNSDNNNNKRLSKFSLNDFGVEKELGLVMKFIYKGYHEKYYYWELIIFWKKMILVFLSTFTEFFPRESKATVLLVIISIFLLLQIRVQPYEQRFLNVIEFYSLFVTFVTANIGILLFSEDFKKGSLALLIIMVLINFSFIMYWAYVYIIGKKKEIAEKRRRKSALKKTKNEKKLQENL